MHYIHRLLFYGFNSCPSFYASLRIVRRGLFLRLAMAPMIIIGVRKFGLQNVILWLQDSFNIHVLSSVHLLRSEIGSRSLFVLQVRVEWTVVLFKSQLGTLE